MRRRPRHSSPALRRANALMKNEHYAEAGKAFEKIAQHAKRRRHSRTPIYYLRAGRAYMLAENPEEGMPFLTRGLTILAGKKQWQSLLNYGQRTIDELTTLGYLKEAQEIADLLEKRLPTTNDEA